MEFYKRYTLTTQHGFISESGVHAILSYINKQDLRTELWTAANPGMNRSFLPPLPLNDWDWEWIVTKGIFRGTLPKRIASHYAKMHNIKCPSKFITEIGNIAKSHTSAAETYTFEFVDEIDWDAGEFGEEPDSCYWNDRAGARLMITRNGGFAVRFYGQYEQGIARAWMAKIEDSLWVMWNGYGFAGNTTLTIARIVATHLNLTYKKIDLTNYGSDYGTLYINAGIGYAIGTQSKIEPIYKHDLRWITIDVSVCYECGDEMNEDEYRIGADDHRYCDRCYERLFDYCERCEETHWIDNLRYTGSETVCEDCLRRHYVQCDECYDHVDKSDARTIGDRTLCENCYDDDEIEEIDDDG